MERDDEADQVMRLTRFRAEHPDVIVGAADFGTWQGRIPEPNGETVVVRHTLRELLNRLDELTGLGGTVVRWPGRVEGPPRLGRHRTCPNLCPRCPKCPTIRVGRKAGPQARAEAPRLSPGAAPARQSPSVTAGAGRPSRRRVSWLQVAAHLAPPCPRPGVTAVGEPAAATRTRPPRAVCP